jgi:O-antigen/teichoic acid export membrane protein
MISKFRMKIDLLGQAILIVAILLLAFFASGMASTNAMLVVLGVWQLASAFHLLYVYRHIKRLNFVKTALVLTVSLPVWIHLVGNLAYLPVAGVVVWYFIQTISDTIRVYNRPRSFWDL